MTRHHHINKAVQLETQCKPSHTDVSLTLALEDLVRHLARCCAEEHFQQDRPDFSHSANDERW